KKGRATGWLAAALPGEWTVGGAAGAPGGGAFAASASRTAWGGSSSASAALGKRSSGRSSRGEKTYSSPAGATTFLRREGGRIVRGEAPVSIWKRTFPNEKRSARPSRRPFARRSGFSCSGAT